MKKSNLKKCRIPDAAPQAPVNRNLRFSAGSSSQHLAMELLEQRRLYSASSATVPTNALDYGILAGNFGQAVTGGWEQGDLNYDGLPIAINSGNLGNVQRLDNPTTGDHLETKDTNEVSVLIASGNWVSEGAPFSDVSIGLPVYRLFNASLQQHLFTSDLNEKIILTTEAGWRSEGIAFEVNSVAAVGQTPLYRLYNSVSGSHLLTSDSNEYTVLGQTSGWSAEGIVGYVQPSA